MLSDTDKDDVNREVEREAYRATLAPSRSKSERLKTFLNTSLGLWLLSAVFLSGLTAGTAKLFDSLQAQAAREARRTALHDELLIRYMRMYGADHYQNADQFGLQIQKSEERYLTIFLRARRPPTVGGGAAFAELETVDLYLEVERTSDNQEVKRLAQNVWKLASRVEVTS